MKSETMKLKELKQERHEFNVIEERVRAGKGAIHSSNSIYTSLRLRQCRMKLIEWK